MNKFLIIQPHSDDALFSVSHLIFSDKEISILTIENNAKRVFEDEKLYNFLEKEYHHLSVDFDDQCYYSFHKQYESLNSENGNEFLREYFGKDKLTEIKNAIAKFVADFIKKSKNRVVIYIPWGIGHPFHLFVRESVESLFSDDCEIRFYRDFPHSYKKRASKQVEEQLSCFKLYKKYPIEDFADVKWDLAKKFYKTQSGLLWFEQGYIKKNLPEEIYIRK